MTSYFPSLLSREFASAQERLGADVERMAALYDHHEVRGGPAVELTDERVGAFEEVLVTTNEVLERLRLLSRLRERLRDHRRPRRHGRRPGLPAADAVGPGARPVQPLRRLGGRPGRRRPG